MVNEIHRTCPGLRIDATNLGPGSVEYDRFMKLTQLQGDLAMARTMHLNWLDSSTSLYAKLVH